MYEYTTIYPFSYWRFQLGANTFYTPRLLLYSSKPVAQMSGVLDALLCFCWVIVLKLGSCVTLGPFLK